MAGWSEKLDTGARAPRGGAGVFLRASALDRFGDDLCLRDPAGRSRRPHLTPTGNLLGDRGFLVRGPITLRLRYAVSKADGIRFCRATGDDNPIHILGEIVPGAYTAAKALLPIELLFPKLELRDLSVRFSSIARYRRPQVLLLHVTPGPEGATFRAETLEEGVVTAEVEARARWTEPSVPATTILPRGAGEAGAARFQASRRLGAVRDYLRSLHVEPRAYFGRAARDGYFYPRSFLAAMPSGAMVRQLRGEGGLLNKLSLEFEGGRAPIVTGGAAEVSLERPKARRTFNKVLAAISDGLRTYVRGTALVLSKEAAPPALVASILGSITAIPSGGGAPPAATLEPRPA